MIDWGIKLVGIPQFWKKTKGEGIRVGILDSGITPTHPSLINTIEDAKDFTGSSEGAFDTQGHGTHVAGTILARGPEIVGVAPGATGLIGKVLNGSRGQSTWVSSGIRWLINQQVDIISMSFGSPQYSRLIHQEIKLAVSKGIFVITASGERHYPGKYSETIAVGAVDRRLNGTQFSDRSDIVAPGHKILSTFPPDKIAKLSGPSMATPLVSGVVALMLSHHRKMQSSVLLEDNEQLRTLLRETAQLDNNLRLIDPTRLLERVAA